MATVTRWKKWAAVVSVAGVSATMLASLFGLIVGIARDRGGVEVRLTQQEAAQKSAADRMNTVDGRLNTNDAKWDRLETRIDSIDQNLAVVKAIVERIEKREASGRPANDQLDRAQQQSQEHATLTQGDGVR